MMKTEGETGAWNLPPIQSDDLLSQSHTLNDVMRQLLGFHRHDDPVYPGDRQDTPSALNTWSSSKERPSYSKFTFGLSSLIAPSFVLPQQVSLPRGPPPGNRRQDSPNSSFRSSTSSYGEEENRNFSPTVRYHIDSGTLFGDVESEPPAPPTRERRARKVLRRPPTPSSEEARPRSAPRKKADFSKAIRQRYGITWHRDHYQRTRTIRTSPETGYLRAEDSPDDLFGNEDFAEIDDEKTRAPPRSWRPSQSNMSGSYSPGDEDSPGAVPKRNCAPCFKLSSQFKEYAYPGKVVEVTGNEFHHFINNHELAAVLFYNSTEDMEDTLNVWATKSLKKPLDGDQAFAAVDCAADPELCAREQIPSNPFYKVYAEGYPITSSKNLKSLNL